MQPRQATHLYYFGEDPDPTLQNAPVSDPANEEGQLFSVPNVICSSRVPKILQIFFSWLQSKPSIPKTGEKFSGHTIDKPRPLRHPHVAASPFTLQSLHRRATPRCLLLSGTPCGGRQRWALIPRGPVPLPHAAQILLRYSFTVIIHLRYAVPHIIKLYTSIYAFLFVYKHGKDKLEFYQKKELRQKQFCSILFTLVGANFDKNGIYSILQYYRC
jgi:hypothetical protein